jgi:nicotine blue oxidoreductase
MGGPKALVLWEGRRLVDRQVAVLRAAGCDPVAVVLGAAVVDVPGAEVVVNPGWTAGMGSSLGVGLRHLMSVAGDAPAAAVVLVDQPLLTADAVRRTVAACKDAGGPAARASYAGRPGHPVVLFRGVWEEVADSVTGDAGARGWLAAHAGDVLLVPCDGLGDDRDADTTEDVARLAGGAGDDPRATVPGPPEG